MTINRFAVVSHTRGNLPALVAMMRHLGEIAIHTRYDRCAHTFMSAITLAAIILFWLPRSQARA